MRHFGHLLSAVLLCLTIGSAHAQETSYRPLVTIDQGATAASREQAKTQGKTEAGNQVATTTTASLPRSLFYQADPVPVITWNGGQMTNVEVSATLHSLKPASLGNVDPALFPALPVERQREVVKDLVYGKIVQAQAGKAGITANSPEIQAALAKDREAMLARLYYERELEPRMMQLTEESARQYYESKKDDLYTRPAQIVGRVIQVPFYETYETNSSDTLELLADRAGLEKSKTDRILINAAPFFPRSFAGGKAGLPALPIVAGESLLVPLAADKIASATVALEKLRENLLVGKTSDDLLEGDEAFSTSSMSGNIAFDESTIRAELLKEVTGSAGTTVTKVIKLEDGLLLGVVTARVTTQTATFEEVKSKILEEVAADETQKRKTAEEIRATVLEGLIKKYGLKIRTDLLERKDYGGTDPIAGNTPLAEMDGFQYTRDDFVNEIRPLGKGWPELSYEQRLNIVKAAQKVTQELVAREAKALQLDKSPRFQQEMAARVQDLIVQVHLGKLGTKANTPTQDQLRDYYKDNIDKYTEPARVTFRELGKRVNLTLLPIKRNALIDASRKTILEIKGRIKNETDFDSIARRESEAIGSRSRGGLVAQVPANFRGAPFKNQLRQLKPGDISEPFLYGSELLIVMLLDRVEATPKPFEEVATQVQLEWMRTMPSKILQEQQQAMLDEADVKVLF